MGIIQSINDVFGDLEVEENTSCMRFLTYEDLKDLEYLFWEELYTILDLVSDMPKNDEDFVVADFDDTIFSRNGQVFHNMFRENRWDSAFFIIDKYIWWLDKFISTFYLWDFIACPKFVKIIKLYTSLILTAWREDLQRAKIEASWLSSIPSIVVSDSRTKPSMLIRYIIFKLWYIPREIHIFEDKPEYFKNLAGLLARLFQTKICIHKVWYWDDIFASAFIENTFCYSTDN